MIECVRARAGPATGTMLETVRVAGHQKRTVPAYFVFRGIVSPWLFDLRWPSIGAHNSFSHVHTFGPIPTPTFNWYPQVSGNSYDGASLRKLLIRGESSAFGQCMPWMNRLFSKSMKRKILTFLHEVEKMISVISVQVYSKKWDFPSLKKNRPHFQETKVNFFWKLFSIKIGKTEFSL